MLFNAKHSFHLPSLIFLFRDKSYHVAMAVLELTMQTNLTQTKRDLPASAPAFLAGIKCNVPL